MTGPEAAPRLEGRTVTLELDTPYQGWWIEWRTDFPARYLEAMAEADSWPAVCRVLDRWIVVAHNFPDLDGNVAASMLDVMPIEAVGAAMAAAKKASALPNP